jgi:hypothetical protein
LGLEVVDTHLLVFLFRRVYVFGCSRVRRCWKSCGLCGRRNVLGGAFGGG